MSKARTSRADTTKPGSFSNGTRIVIPHSPKWHQKLLCWLIVALAKSCMWTWRIEWTDRAGLLTRSRDARPPLLFSIWHNRLAVSMSIYAYVRARRPAGGLAALISASRDGGLLAEVLAKFGVQPVRGSSSRRGAQALLEATTWAERGYHVAITPDGPRGPKYQVQDGIISLAQVTGLEIVPVSVEVGGKVCARSWDQFQIPLPFAKCKVTFGSPLTVPRGTSEAERESYRRLLQQAMVELIVIED